MSQEPVVAVAEEKVKQFAVVQQVYRPVRRVVVGFMPKAIDDVEKLMPDFSKLYDKKSEEAEGFIASRKKHFLDTAPWHVHTATFSSVCVSSTLRDSATMHAEGRAPGTNKPPICQAVRKWIFDRFPHVWKHPKDWPEGHVAPQVLFIGFNVTYFLRLLALECAMPENACPLPMGLWFPGKCVDLSELFCDQSPRLVSVEAAIARRLPPGYPDSPIWANSLKDWKGPGYDADKDHYLALDLAAQLGFLHDSC